MGKQMTRRDDAVSVIKQYEEIISTQEKKMLDCSLNMGIF